MTYSDFAAHAPLATLSEAHYEWHANSGTPMGEPCPMDACHPMDNPFDYMSDEEIAQYEAEATIPDFGPDPFYTDFDPEPPF